jgi:hypothetical protein
MIYIKNRMIDSHVSICPFSKNRGWLFVIFCFNYALPTNHRVEEPRHSNVCKFIELFYSTLDCNLGLGRESAINSLGLFSSHICYTKQTVCLCPYLCLLWNLSLKRFLGKYQGRTGRNTSRF